MALISYGTVNSSGAPGVPLVLNNPSTQQGDLLIVGLCVGSSAQTVTAPAGQGWVNFASSPPSGNSGANIRLYRRFTGASDPTSFSFSFGTTDVNNGFIVALSGVDPTTPIDGFSIVNIASGGGRSQQTGTLTPSILGCQPLAMFGVQQIDTGNPGAVSTTSNFSISYINNTAQTAQYHSSVGMIGPLTTDTTTPIQASVMWNSIYTTTTGAAALLLIKPATPGSISFSPATINLAGAGASAAITVNQSSSNSPISLVSSSNSIATVSPTSVQPGGTVTVNAIAAGTFTITATGA